MERKMNCESAAAALSDMIHLIGLPSDGLYALHDPSNETASRLVAGMQVLDLARGSDGTIISGPLNADQAAVLGVVGCMTTIPVEVITPKASPDLSVEYADGGEAVAAAAEFCSEDCHFDGALGNFIHDLSLDLNAALGVNDGVIEVVEDTPTPYGDDVMRIEVDGREALLERRELDAINGGTTIGFTELECGTLVSDNLHAFLQEDVAPPAGGPEPSAFEQRVETVDYADEPERSQILIDAAVAVTGERQNQYGEPEDSLAGIAAYWSVYFGAEFTPKDVAIMMSLLKIARSESGYHRDNYVDAAGYLGLAGEADLNAVTTPNGRSIH